MVSELRHLQCKFPKFFVSHVENTRPYERSWYPTHVGHPDMRGEALSLDVEERMYGIGAPPVQASCTQKGMSPARGVHGLADALARWGLTMFISNFTRNAGQPRLPYRPTVTIRARRLSSESERCLLSSPY